MNPQNNISKIKSSADQISLITLTKWSLIAMLALGFIGLIVSHFIGVDTNNNNLSNLSDVINTFIGLPIAFSGTLLALFLALNAYNLSKENSIRDTLSAIRDNLSAEREALSTKRDNLTLFYAKYGETSKLFTTISLRLSRLISLSDAIVPPFKKLQETISRAKNNADYDAEHDAEHDADYDDPNRYETAEINSAYTDFFQTISYKLHSSDFMKELKALEEDFIKLLTDPVASHLFTSKLKKSSLSSIISSIRGWGSIISTSSGNFTSRQLGKDLFNHLHSKSLVELYIYTLQSKNNKEKNYLNAMAENDRAVIDTESLSLVFFSSLLDSREISSAVLNNEDFKNLTYADEQLSSAARLAKGKDIADSTRERKRFEKLNGIHMLKDIINAIPSNKELAEKYAEAISIEEPELTVVTTIGTNPKTILEDEIKRLDMLLIRLELQGGLRYLGIESDFYPVNLSRHIFSYPPEQYV